MPTATGITSRRSCSRSSIVCEHDPFSLGDSDDEDQKTKDVSPEDSERLKKAAEAKAEEAKVKEAPAAELKPAERSGSVGQKDAAAEALLKEAK